MRSVAMRCEEGDGRVGSAEWRVITRREVVGKWECDLRGCAWGEGEVEWVEAVWAVVAGSRRVHGGAEKPRRLQQRHRRAKRMLRLRIELNFPADIQSNAGVLPVYTSKAVVVVERQRDGRMGKRSAGG